MMMTLLVVLRMLRKCSVFPFENYFEWGFYFGIETVGFTLINLLFYGAVQGIWSNWRMWAAIIIGGTFLWHS